MQGAAHMVTQQEYSQQDDSPTHQHHILAEDSRSRPQQPATLVFRRRHYGTNASQFTGSSGSKQLIKSLKPRKDICKPGSSSAGSSTPALFHYFDPRRRQSSLQAAASSLAPTDGLIRHGSRGSLEAGIARHSSITSEDVTLQQQLLDRLQHVQQQKERCMAMLLGLNIPQQQSSQQQSLQQQQQQQLPALSTPAAAGFLSASSAAAAALNSCDSPQFSCQSQHSRHLLFRQPSLEVSTAGQHSPALAAAAAAPSALPLQHADAAACPGGVLLAAASAAAPAPPQPAMQAPAAAAAAAAAAEIEPSPSAGELAVLQQLLLAVAAAPAPAQPACPLQDQLLQALAGYGAPQAAAAAAPAEPGPLPALLQLLQAAATLQNGCQ